MRCFGCAVLSLIALAVIAAPAYAAIDMTDVVGLWLFDEGEGTVVNDSSGRENHGTFNGTPQWVEGVFGGALNCATGGHVLIKDSDSLDLDKAWTLTTWVNMTPPMERWQTILNKRYDVATNYVIRLQDTGKWEVMVNNGGWVRLGDPSPAKGNQWVHLAGTYDGASVLTLFVDGEQVATRSGIKPPPVNNIDLRLGSYSGNSGGMAGLIDETAIFDVALAPDEIRLIKEDGLAAALNMSGSTKAGSPSPEDGAVDVPSDTILSWTTGASAATHDVYLGKTFADVNDASRANPMGGLASQGQTATAYDADGLLEYAQAYYWRIDEVNAAPDNTIFKGDIWSFTTEPYAYPLASVAAKASGSQAGTSPERTVDGSGLNADDQHSTELTQMWMSDGATASWIQYEFDKVYMLHELWVWNSNQLVEPFIGFGARNVTIEYSVDGATWTTLEGVPEFARASGSSTYTANTIVDFGSRLAKFVKLTIDQTWGGLTPQAGLSEVRFFYVPVQAREPQPADGATGVSIDTDLNWRPGRDAQSHDVYFGAGAAGSAPVAAVTEHNYAPGPLNLGTTYYWKVDEVGAADTYEGNLWSFTTQESAVLEDFESYNDDDSRIYDTWIDGWVNDTGSQVGYIEAPFAERKIVHGGRQSMPLAYDNSASPFYSEAQRTFDDPQDWTMNGAGALSLWVRGNPGDPPTGNAPADLYVVVQDSTGKTATATHPTAVTAADWTPWEIPLSDFTGVSAGRVEKLTIGVGDRTNPKAGGAGLIYLDDIHLTKP